MKRTALVVALAALAVGSASAQDREIRRERPQPTEAHRELIGSLKEFARTNILPQLTTWKGQLDGAMSADDLQKLNGLRSRAASLKKQAMDYGRSMREAWRDEDYDRIREIRAKLKELRNDHRAILEELKPLAEKYRPTLEAIGQDAKPKVEGWKQEGKAIVEKWMAQNSDQMGEMKHHMRGMMHGMGKWFGRMDRGTHRKMMVARFMLWDGSNFLDQLEQHGGQGMEGLEDLNIE
jgi:hypothetical protein